MTGWLLRDEERTRNQHEREGEKRRAPPAMTFCNAQVHLRVAASVIVSACVVTGAWDVTVAAGPQSPPPAPLASAAAVHRATLDRYCVTCHNARAKTAGLVLDGMNLDAVPDHAEVWEKVVRKLRAGTMPPQGAPQPDEATRSSLTAWLETTIDVASAARPNPGRPALHRLNRAEYQNAIRDLLALDVDAASLLPADDSSYGFDNIADVLGVSPVLLERYLGAAERISALAVGDPAIRSRPMRPIACAVDLTQTRHIDGLPLGTRGGTLIHADVPARRRVRDQVEALAHQRRDSSAASRIRTRSRSRSTGSACTWSPSARRRISPPR